MEDANLKLRGGLGKLYLGELLTLVGSALTLVPVLGALAGLVLALVGGVIALVGIVKLKDMHEGYMRAFLILIWSLILTVVGGTLGGMVGMVVDLALAVLLYMQMGAVVKATNHFLLEQGEIAAAEMGEQAKRLYMNAMIVYIVLTLSADIMAEMLTPLLLLAFGVLAVVVFVAGSAYYVMYLGKAKDIVVAQLAIEGE